MESHDLGKGLVAWARVALLVLTCGVLGCGASVQEDLGRYTARGAVAGVYDAIGGNPRQSVAAALAQDPNVRKAAHDLAEAMVTGAGDGAAKLEVDGRVQTLVTTILVTAAKQGDQALAQILADQGPRLTSLVRDTMKQSIEGASAALRTKAGADLSEATHDLVTTAVGAFSASLPRKDDAVAALGQGSQELTAGAVRGMLAELDKETTRTAMGALAKQVTTQATEGIDDVVQRRLKQSEAGPSFWVALSVVGLTLLVAVGSALALLVRRYLLAARALSLVAGMINESGHKELKQRIRAKAELVKLQPFLHGFLSDRGL